MCNTCNIRCLIIFFVITGMQFSPFAQNSERNCRIKSIVGSAKIRRSGTINWVDARANMPVKERDAVRTFIESELELLTSEGSIIKIGENSTLELNKLDQKDNADNTKIKIMNGNVAANVKKLINNRSEFEFETPTATAAIRGTIVGFDVNKEKTIIKVYEGSVLVTPQGSRTGSELKDNQMTSVTKGQKVITIEKLTEKSPILLPEVKSGKSDSLTVDTIKIDTSAIKIDTSATKADTSATKADTSATKADTSATKADASATKVLNASASKTDTSTMINPHNIPTDSVKKGISMNKTIIDTQKIIDNKSKTITLKSSKDVDVLEEKVNTFVPKIVTDTIKKEKISPNIVVPVRLTVSSPIDRTIVKPSSIISISGTVTPVQSILTINGKTVSASSSGSFKTNLTTPVHDGDFEILITGENGTSTQTITKTVTVKQTVLQFEVNSPAEGQVFKKTVVPVSGIVTHGAEVTAMSIKLPITSSGSFSGQIPIPNEEGEVYIELEASLDGKYQNITRKVIYEPEYRFTLASPQNEQEVNSTTIQIRGEILPVSAKVTVMGKSLMVSSAGNFSGIINVPDEEGEIELDFEISTGVMFKTERRTVIYKKPRDIIKPEIQASLPLISDYGKIAITIYDRTPEDEITFWYEIDGQKDYEKGTPNSSFNLILLTGMHTYSIYATDKTGNQSAVFKQDITWFGTIDWNIRTGKNSETLHLPPAGPGNTYDPVYTIDFTIDNLPENDMRLMGSVSVINKTSGEIITKKTFTDNYFTFDVKLKNHSVNIIDIVAEDIRKNIKTKTITVYIK